jgi:16S rRNA A1518/A1519 N6-dimethyltransferase RsmA/KsgA/DIM1 with predicted DNA glycosylase/AP lyase activity
METELIPRALAGLDLGPDVLEVGPGYGIATSILGTLVTRLTCVEIDGFLAELCHAEGANERSSNAC